VKAGHQPRRDQQSKGLQEPLQEQSHHDVEPLSFRGRRSENSLRQDGRRDKCGNATTHDSVTRRIRESTS
jgi:hypothetical protein